MAKAATKQEDALVVTAARPESLVEPIEADSDEFESSVLALCWKHRRAIGRAAGLGFVASTIIALLIPNRYESVTRLMPPDQTGSGSAMLAAALSGGISGGRGSGLGSIAGDLLGLKSTGDEFIGVLESRSVENALIEKFELRKRYRDKLIEDARIDLEKHTNISADRRSGIITIQVADRDPLQAKAMAQEYVNQLNHVVTSLNTSSAGREREFLEQRLVQVKSDLEAAERSFSEFASHNTAIDIPAQGKAMIEAAATLEGELIAAQTELESLRQIYTDQNVRVRATQARVDELKRQLQKVGGTGGGNATVAIDSSGQSIPSIKQLPLLGVPYADLYRNTKVREAIYETLTEEYELAKVQEAKETPSVKVLDPPDVPEKKSFPPRLLIIIIGSFVALSASISWIIVNRTWQLIPTTDSRKVILLEMVKSFRAIQKQIPRTEHLNDPSVSNTIGTDDDAGSPGVHKSLGRSNRF
jgi:capsule polysaccharide export protein KpsE/RkpR